MGTSLLSFVALPEEEQKARGLGSTAKDYLSAGVAAQITGHPKLAESDLQQAINVDPLFWQARVALASLNQSIQNNEIEHAGFKAHTSN